MSIEEKPESPFSAGNEGEIPSDTPSWLTMTDPTTGLEEVDLPFSTESDKPSRDHGLIRLPSRKKERAARPRNVEEQEKARHRQELFMLKERRAKKRRKVFFSRLRSFLKVIFILVMLFGLYWISRLDVWHFSEKHFALHGGHLVTRQHLARYLHTLQDKPIYLINPAPLQQAIQREIPLIDKIYVRRRLFPVGLDISIIEKPSWGLLYPQFPPVKADKEDSADTAQVTGAVNNIGDLKPLYLLHWDNTMTDLANYQLTPEEIVQMGHPIPIVSNKTSFKPDELRHYREISQLLNSQPDQARLQYLDITNPYELFAYFDGFKVRLGRLDRSIDNRISELFSLIPAIREHQSTIDMVDLRWNQQIIFKKKPAVNSKITVN